MILPFGTDRPLARPTQVTYWLIALNIIVFGIGVFWDRFDPDGHRRLEDVLVLDPNQFRWWALFTYQFLHAGLWHLAGNMVILLVFGPNVEDRMGRWWFALFYLTAGAIAGGAHCLLTNPIHEIGPIRILPSVVGASGSIAGVTGAYMVLFPLTNIRIVLFFMVAGVYHFPAWAFIAFAICKDMFFQGLGDDNGVARIAHLGGYAWGIAVSLALLWSRLLPRETYDLFSMMKHAHRRRQFKELASQSSPWRADAGSAIAPAAAIDPKETRIADLRAEVHRLHAAGRMKDAGEAYIKLLGATGETAMHRAAQIDISNHFFAVGKYQPASEAYEAFLKRFPGDAQTAHVRLMLALINARYLNDPVRAKALLKDLRDAGLEEPHVELARTLEKELG